MTFPCLLRLLTSAFSPYNLGLYAKIDFFRRDNTLIHTHTHTHIRTHLKHKLFLFHLLHTQHLHLVHPAHPQLPPSIFTPRWGSRLQLPLRHRGSEVLGHFAAEHLQHQRGELHAVLRLEGQRAVLFGVLLVEAAEVG